MNGFSLARVMAVLTKEFVQLRRDRSTYAMILAVPVDEVMRRIDPDARLSGS